MKETIGIIFFLIITFGCSENSPTITEEFNIKGKIIVDNSDFNLNELIVQLEGNNILVDTVNEAGEFNFIVNELMVYKLSINNPLFRSYDSSLTVTSDVNIQINLLPLDDFFPLSIGNWWIYELNYKPMVNDDIWWEGKVKWEIVGLNVLDSSNIYKIKETINGIEILGNPINSNLDTNMIVDKINNVDFILTKDLYVKIGSGTGYGSRPIVCVKRYHEEKANLLTFDSYFSRPYSEDQNLIHDYFTGHRIQVEKNVGIKFWNIDNRSNSSPDGDLVLIDYSVESN